MTTLSESEEALVTRRRRGLGAFLGERVPVLIDFASRLDLPSPESICLAPSRYLEPIDTWARQQFVAGADRAWLLTRLGYFVGECVAGQFGGSWFLDEVAGSRFFGRYVVGRFQPPIAPAAMIDPFGVADAYLAEAVGIRDLSRLLAQVSTELASV